MYWNASVVIYHNRDEENSVDPVTGEKKDNLSAVCMEHVTSYDTLRYWVGVL